MAPRGSINISVNSLRNLTLTFLLLPNIIFVASWLRPFYAVSSVVLFGAVFYYVVFTTREKITSFSLHYFELAAIVIASIGICMIYGIGEFNQQVFDWQSHNAKFRDLTSLSWPVYYKKYDVYLCYYIAYYLVPALLGKFIGLAYVHYFVLLWTASGLFLVLLWILSLNQNLRQRWLIMMLCLTYGGSWSVIYLCKILAYSTGIGSDYFPNNLISIQGYILAYAAPLSRNFQWAPQHTLSGVLGLFYVIYLFQSRQNSKKMVELTILIGSTILWSPFVTVGLLPFVAYLWYSNQGYKWSNLLICLASGSLFLPIIIFITDSSVSSGAYSNRYNHFIWQLTDSNAWILYLLFIIAHFVSWFFFLKDSLGTYKPLFYVAFASGLLIPLYRMGIYNDFNARVIIPASTVFMILIATHFTEKAKINLKTFLYFLFFLVNAASPLKILLDQFPPKAPESPIAYVYEKSGYLGKPKNMLDYHTVFYGGKDVSYQFSLKKNGLFEKVLLRKPEIKKVP